MRSVVQSVSSAFALSASTLALLLAGSFAVQAQTFVWDGSESASWLNGDNWVGGTVPPVGANVTVTGPAIHMPTINGGSATANMFYLGYDANLGGVTATITNGANLTTTSASIGEQSINNAGNLRELESGTGTMSGASTWITDFLQVGAYGTGIVNITDDSGLTVNNGLTIGEHRNLTTLRFGTGTISITGAGSRLSAAGTTIVGSSGIGTLSVTAGGKFTSGSVTVGKNAQGEGSVSVNGTGSRWDVNGGVTVNIGQDGTGDVEIINGGVFNSTGMIVLGVNTGSGDLTVSGAGSTLKAGQVRIGGNGSGTDGTGTFSATAGAVVDVTHFMLGSAATGVGSATISGQNTSVTASTYAMLGWNGKGTITLSNSATLKTPLTLLGYSAGSEGTLNIGAAAGSAAAASGTLDSAEVRFGAGTGTLVFNHTNTDLSFAPKITGAGTVHHVAGTTKLTANNSAFAGTTTIDGSTLRALNGLGGVIAVNSGGTFGGTGTIGATDIRSGGTIDPDGTLSVAGNLTFQDGSTYLVNVGNGTADRITATGTATLDGNVKLRPEGKLAWNETHTILSAATLAGTFDGISSTSTFVDATLDYSTPNEVRIALTRNGVKFEDVAKSTTQQAIGQVLTNLPIDDPLVMAMFSLSAEEARDAMDELSGDTHSTLNSTSMAVAGQVQGLVMNRIRQSFTSLGSGAGSVSSYLPSDYDAGGSSGLPVTFWMQGMGEYTHVRATTTAGGLDAGTGGILAGADVLVDDWRLGAIAGYSRTGFDAVGRSATGAVQNLHAGLYAGAEFDAVRLQFNALQTWHGISSNRVLAFGGFTDTLAADYGSRTSMVHGEVGYAFDLGGLAIEPFGSASYAATNTDAYTETGGSAALSSSASRNDAMTTVVGLRSSTAMAVSDKLVTFNGMVGWQHQSGQAPTTEFTLAGSTPFTVTGANTASDALVYEAGVNLDLSEQFNVDLLYAGRMSPGDFSHSIKGIVAASF